MGKEKVSISLLAILTSGLAVLSLGEFIFLYISKNTRLKNVPSVTPSIAQAEVKGVKLTYMGDARYNMGNSLMVVCAKLGMHFTACTTKKYFPDAALVKECEAIAKQTGAFA